jgi:RIP metalloprotease RseP
MPIIIAILALSVLIIVHELGHFLVAKASGILVHEFSLFMGPKLFSVKKGDTTYSLRAIPLGGYVRMEGEEEASDNERAFNRKPILTRIAVIAAGPIMNLVIAVLFFFIVYNYSGYSTSKINEIADNSPAVTAGLQKGDKIVSYNGKKVYDYMDEMLFVYASKGSKADISYERNGKPYTATITPVVYPETTRYILGFTPKAADGTDSNLVDSVSKDTPAEKAGIKSGDRIVQVNDAKITNRQQLNDYLLANKDKPVDVIVNRDGKPLTISQITPMNQKTPEQYYIGFDFTTEKGNFFDTLKQSFISCYSTTRQMFYNLVWLINGTISSKNMMGPVGIVSSIGTVVKQSPGVMEAVINLLSFSALISINLGVFNLIPFPALDGSKIILMIVEKIRRKPIPPEKEATISLVGFAILIFIMIFATSNDIMRLFNKM